MKTYIYTLAHPITNEIRYVGRTSRPYYRRYSHQSMFECEKGNNHRTHWIKSLLTQGLKPVFEILDECEYDIGLIEQYWISQFKVWGFRLTNSTDGGE